LPFYHCQLFLKTLILDKENFAFL